MATLQDVCRCAALAGIVLRSTSAFLTIACAGHAYGWCHEPIVQDDPGGHCVLTFMLDNTATEARLLLHVCLPALHKDLSRNSKLLDDT